MKMIYLSLVITTFGGNYCEPRCTFWQKLDNDELVKTSLELKDALKLMWELKLAGGEKTMEINAFNPHIATRTVTFWARH